MDKPGCNCGKQHPETTCRICGGAMPLPYWCEMCERLVPAKRCPYCGLKARKVRQPGTSTKAE